MTESLLLALILSADAFAASVAYGADRIRIPRSSALMISGICSGLLALSLLLGGIIAPLLPTGLCRGIAFAILFFLGAAKLFDSSIKGLISRHSGKRMQFRLFDVEFILQIYADPGKADRDRSRVLSLREAASLAVAMSLDGLTIGFGAALGDINAPLTFLFSFIITFLAVLGGEKCGEKLSRRFEHNLGWISGLVLMAMAVLKLLSAV